MHKIIQADIYSALKSLQDNTIDIAITSPPYWAQRNYGFEKQIGNEKTYIEYISRLIFLFNILKNKLTDKGVFFLNIGDKYLNKYGKTPLGLIPYKLAYFMKQNGWIINDTIIWHKPNRMPSSVKNRFVNSYEPVFVFSKNSKNYFSDYVNKNQDYSNVIDINLQPTPYNHVAVYPEKLVHKLLDFVEIDKDFTVLDPFAGSGTTLKVIIDRNESMFSNLKAAGIMIEYNPDYVKIIKERTNVDNIEVKALNYKAYQYDILNEENLENRNCDKNDKLSNKLNVVNIFDSKTDFCKALNTISDKNFIRRFPANGIIFLGLKNYSIEDIFNISLIKNWIIRNKLVVRRKKWFPLFMLVQDNKTHKYIFNYKDLLLNHKSNQSPKYLNLNFLGYRVENNLNKKKSTGIIVKILEKYSNGLPKYVIVFWEDSGKLTKEFVINDTEEINKNIEFFQNNGYVSVRELKEITGISNIVTNRNEFDFTKVKKQKIKNYKGKFTDLERKNWGASPGARSSVEEEIFIVQRLYGVNQNLIADYLNYIREKNNLTKKSFIELFPKEYKHTIGHWLRKDFGGSIPVKEDWELIENFFEIDQNIKNYVCKTALKLQTVNKTKYKLPDDVIDEKMINKLILLNNEFDKINFVNNKKIVKKTNNILLS